MSTRPDLTRRGVVAVLKSAAPSGTDVVWARHKYPRRASIGASVVTVQRVRGPELGVDIKQGSLEPLQLLWVLASVTEGDQIGLATTGARWRHTVLAAATVESSRDAVLAILQAEALPGVTLTSEGTDSIRADAGVVLGLLWGAAAIGENVTVTAPVTQLAETITRPTLSTIELHAYAHDAGGAGLDAEAILADILGGLESSALTEVAGDYGVIVKQVGDILDASALAGSQWDSRATCRLEAKGRSYAAFATDEVTTVDYSVVVEDTLTGTVAKP